MHNESQETRERRPEPLRIALYILLTGAILLLGMMLNAAVTEHLLEGQSEGLTMGERMAIYSYCVAYLQPLLIMLVNRRLTFRSGKPLPGCLLRMLACAIAVNVIQTALMLMVSRYVSPLDLPWLSRLLIALEHLAYYLYQRYFLFRNSLDTL